MQLLKAERRQAKIKLSLQGPSGSGKTYSALLMAYGITQDWTKIAVIDSENGSAHLYAHLGEYNVLPLSTFSPDDYIKAIDVCVDSGIELIVIDSISHEWDYILNWHSSLAGNSYLNWSKVLPSHNAFIHKMLQVPVHVIATTRSKQDYVLVEKNGKMVPEKVGMKGIQRDGVDYEFTVCLTLDVKHYAQTSKDRTDLFMMRGPFIISEETGELLKAWASQGTRLDEVREMIKGCKDLDKLRDLYKKYPEFKHALNDLFLQRSEELNLLTTKTTDNGVASNQ